MGITKKDLLDSVNSGVSNTVKKNSSGGYGSGSNSMLSTTKKSSGSGSNTSAVVKKTSATPTLDLSNGLLGSNIKDVVAATTQKNSGTGSNNNYYGVGYDANTDYQAIINDAVARGDYQSAALAELARNAKIVGTGSNLPTTNNYVGYLNPDYGTLGQSQMAAGASWEDVLATYNARFNKAMTTDGLQQYSNDAIQQQMWQYIQENMKSGSQEDAINLFNKWLAEYEKNNPQPEYTSQYDPQMDALLNQILNREDFSYDVTNDPLYQQYAQMYQRNGERAMENTLAEAAAGAGGMNSYAVTAASQAYNNYNAQLNDIIPELYNTAYQMYLNDKESMVQDLGILQNMDATQYGRYRDTMNDYYNDKSFAYGTYVDAINQGNIDRDFNYNSAVSNRDYLNNNIWNNKEWNEEVSNKDESTAKEEVWNYVSLGVMPSAELIAQAGMTETDVRLAIEAVQAEKTKTSKGGGGDYELEEIDEEDDNGYEGNVAVANRVFAAVKELHGKGDWENAVGYIETALENGLISQAEANSLYQMFPALREFGVLRGI